MPELLLIAEETGSRERTERAWSAYLTQAGFEHRHVDPDQLPVGGSVADRVAADAWRFAQWLGWIGSGGVTRAGRRVCAEANTAMSVHDVLAPSLAARVTDGLRGENGALVVPLLDQGAQLLAETENLWARECAGLLPVEVGAIVYWASVQLTKAEHLIDNLVSWRDAAMHRYGEPDPRESYCQIWCTEGWSCRTAGPPHDQPSVHQI